MKSCFLIFVMSNCIILSGGVRSFADLVIDGVTPQTNHRFENDPNFLTSSSPNGPQILYTGMDFSGIGQDTNSRWATLISPNVAITAHHSPATTTISFYPSNDATVSPVTRNITSSFRVPQTDIRLLRLDSNVSSNIAHYSYASTFIDGTLANPNIYAGDIGLMVGISAVTPSSFGSHRQAFGQNRIDGYQENIAFNGSDNDFLRLIDNPVADTTSSGSPFGASYIDTPVEYEAQVRGGDSGAPFFTLAGSELLLLGINSARIDYFNDANGNRRFDSGETFYGEGSGPSYVGNTRSIIQTFIDVNAVPEPGSTVFLSVLSLSILVRRRSR